MKQARFTKESELGPPVVAWLTGEGFDVYQEVDVDSIADIVGVCGPQVAVVELKLSLSFELLHQAVSWRWCAHQIWVGVPHAKRSDGRQMALDCFARMGIGVIQVEPRPHGPPVVANVAPPAFNRNAGGREHLRRALREENRTVAFAGARASERTWTAFKLTCERVRQYLAEHDGAPIGDVVRDVEHHYASDAGARARLVELIRRGVVPGVREEGGRLFRTEAQAA